MAMRLTLPKISFPLYPALYKHSSKSPYFFFGEQEDISLSFGPLNKEIKYYMPRRGRDIVFQAFKLAKNAHAGQVRLSGDPYITHPLAVAQQTAEMKMDYETVSAALLHDVVEDTSVGIDDIKEKFGTSIAFMVDGLTKLDSISIKNKKTVFSDRSGEEQKDSKSRQIFLNSVQSENFQKLFLATARDLRIILIKFSDRLHNLRTIEARSYANRLKTAKETMLIYAPLANNLGMEKMRMEMEDLSFKAAYPMRYQRINESVNQARAFRKDYISSNIDTIYDILKKNKIKARIIGRRKHLAGIYAKMYPESKSWLNIEHDETSPYELKTLEQIMDVYGIRIIVKNLQDCYSVLGIMHSSFSPIQGRVKDYIANPKKNAYQSLHTTVVGPKGHKLELQIRTEAMDYIAESGIAAHFVYKSNLGDPTRAFSWLKNFVADVSPSIAPAISPAIANGANLPNDKDGMPNEPINLGNLNLNGNQGTAEDFVDRVTHGFLSDELLVYTPQGDLINLPMGATPVDFAYAVHTGLGAQCIACEIDGAPAPLNTRLTMGQMVKIITDPSSKPDLSWSAFAVTPKALSHIATYAQMQRNTDIFGVGEKLLRETVVAHFDSDISSISDETWQIYLDKNNIENRNELFAKIATGEITPIVAAAKLLSISTKEPDAKNATSSIGINKGLLTIRYAKCCCPIPGDSIVAVASKGSGIHIHRARCTNILNLENTEESKNMMAAHWEQQGEEYFSGVRCNITGVADTISRIVNLLANNEIAVQEVVTEHSTANLKVVLISMMVRDRKELYKIIGKLRLLRNVTKVVRV